MHDYLLVNGFAYIDGRYQKVNIGVTGEFISYIGKDTPAALKVVDVHHNRILPGFIDPHVHFALYCGTVTSRDDFYYGSKTAAYGGVTTIVDFLDPSRNAKELVETYNRRLLEARRCNIDYHFHACIREPDGDLEEYVLKMKELGINTVKLFTTYSETHRETEDKDIRKLLKLSRKYKFLVCAHIEKDSLIKHDDNLTYKDLPEARSSEAETIEAMKLCEMAVKTKGKLYMVHCSSGNTLESIVTTYGKYIGKYIFIESCPQYFVFNKEVLNKPDGYKYTFAPPLRSENERRKLCRYYSYLASIGTDHCSFNLEDKESHPALNGHPLGVGGIETSFLTMYEMFGDSVIEKMCQNTAKIQRFKHKNGIKVKNYADLVIMSSDPQIVAKPHGAADYSIYEGMHLSNTIVSTISRGKFVVMNGKFYPRKGHLVKCEMKRL